MRAGEPLRSPHTMLSSCWSCLSTSATAPRFGSHCARGTRASACAAVTRARALCRDGWYCRAWAMASGNDITRGLPEAGRTGRRQHHGCFPPPGAYAPPARMEAAIHAMSTMAFILPHRPALRTSSRTAGGGDTASCSCFPSLSISLCGWEQSPSAGSFLNLRGRNVASRGSAALDIGPHSYVQATQIPSPKCDGEGRCPL